MGSIMDADSCKIVKDETDRILHVTGVSTQGPTDEEQHFSKTSFQVLFSPAVWHSLRSKKIRT